MKYNTTVVPEVRSIAVCNGARSHSPWMSIAAVLLSIGLVPSAAQATIFLQNRITTPIRSDQTMPVKNSVHPLVAVTADKGDLSEGTEIHGMSLVFRRSAAQQADLNTLLQQQQTPGSAMYHRWLGPGEFAARYGASASDLAKVAAWLQSQGFEIDAIPDSADRIEFSGSAAQVNAAFATQMRQYQWNGQTRWANALPLNLPAAFAGMTLGITHLNTFRIAPHTTKVPVQAGSDVGALTIHPQYTLRSQSGLLNFVAPADAAIIYDSTGLYNKSITGSGQFVGIAGQTDIVTHISDIANFRTLSGLNSSNLPTQILVPNSGAAVVSVGDLEEADIDVEWSGAAAKDASILYVTVGNDQNKSVFDSLIYAIQHPLASNNTKFIPVLSLSYGGCEAGFVGSSELQSLEQVFQQANAQGQTIVASSGDSGSAGCDYGGTFNGGPAPASHGLGVNYPSSSQYVTAAGGTSFNGDISNQSKYWSGSNSSTFESALLYIPETSWNNAPTTAAENAAGSLSSSGGGASGLFTKPSWQDAATMSDGRRDVPDISLASDPAHDGYVLCTEETNSAGTALNGTSSCVYPVPSGNVAYFDKNKQGFLYGGTSIAAPQIAGLITLWNQSSGNTSGAGNVNPILYLMAQSTPGTFHDTTTGTNAVVCQQGSPNCVSNGAGGFVMSCCSAGTGYDEVTGLGSVDASAMAAAWPKLSVVNGSFSVLSNHTAVTVTPGSTTTTTLKISPSNGFSGTVMLACSNLPAGTTCSFSPGASAIVQSGAAQNVTLTISATSTARLAIPDPLHRAWPLQAMLAGVFCLSLFGVGRARRIFPVGWMATLLLMAGLFAGLAVTGCGSGSPGVGGGSNGSGGTGGIPPGSTQTITVSGTSGATTASTQIQLTIS